MAPKCIPPGRNRCHRPTASASAVYPIDDGGQRQTDDSDGSSGGTSAADRVRPGLDS